MKAKVQYNDLTGTAAADITDFSLNSLEKYLTDHFENYDTERISVSGVGCILQDRLPTRSTSSLFVLTRKSISMCIYVR